MWLCQLEVTEWFICPGSLNRSKSSLLCSHFSPAENQALRGMPHVISRTWFICLNVHHKEETFQISTHKFHSSWFPNFDYTWNDRLCQASISTHSLLTFTMSALNKNLGTSNSVIPQIRNPICLLMEIDWMGQVSSHPARMNMQILYLFGILSSNPCPWRKSNPAASSNTASPWLVQLYTMTLDQQWECVSWGQHALLSPISVIVKQGLASLSAANNMTDRKTFHVPTEDGWRACKVF